MQAQLYAGRVFYGASKIVSMWVLKSDEGVGENIGSEGCVCGQ